MEQVNESPRKTISPRIRIILSFVLGIVAGAAAMFSAGFLYLRNNLIVSYDFHDLAADDFDDALAYEIPAESGWRATPEACTMPLPTGGRAVYNWKLCHRNYARGLMDDPEHGLALPALVPCTVSIASDPEDGHAVVSRLNTSLIGLIYGGNAREILRSHIAPEQEALFNLLADRIREHKKQQKETKQ